MPTRTVTIFGSATTRPGDALYESAKQLGRRCAQSGWKVCNGGYGGTMEAAARGAADAGGRTIGVTCSALGRDGPNRWIAEEIETDNLFDRVRKLIELGDAYVVLPGGTGTLVELSLVWELGGKRLIPSDRPFLMVGGFWQPVIAHLGSEPGAKPAFVESVEAAVEQLAKARPQPG